MTHHLRRWSNSLKEFNGTIRYFREQRCIGYQHTIPATSVYRSLCETSDGTKVLYSLRSDDLDRIPVYYTECPHVDRWNLESDKEINA